MDNSISSRAFRKYALIRSVQFLAAQLIIFNSLLPLGIIVFFSEIYFLWTVLKTFDDIHPKIQMYRRIYLILLLSRKISAVLAWNFFPTDIALIFFFFFLETSLTLETILFFLIAKQLDEKYFPGALKYAAFLQLNLIFAGSVALFFNSSKLIVWQLLYSWLVIPAIFVAWASIFPKMQIIPDDGT